MSVPVIFQIVRNWKALIESKHQTSPETHDTITTSTIVYTCINMETKYQVYMSMCIY
jgi:hypothetical protein